MYVCRASVNSANVLLLHVNSINIDQETKHREKSGGGKEIHTVQESSKVTQQSTVCNKAMLNQPFFVFARSVFSPTTSTLLAYTLAHSYIVSEM